MQALTTIETLANMNTQRPPFPQELLPASGAKIRETEGADPDLLDILVEKILTLVPSEDAVADAVKAIEVLAEERAAETNDGGSDQD